ncbi:MFS transporter [Pusillimonas noertemannii]|uniref:MFS transporter n=1 Tax=Pusillimonas noertemannii TaxID=305977 RepID=UPI003CC67712
MLRCGVAGAPFRRGGGQCLNRHGWQFIFWVGGIVPLVLLVPLAWALSMSRNGEQAAPAPGGRKPGVVRALFDGGLAPHTILLWLFAFVVFINSYALMFWIPSLLMSFGFEAGQTPLGTAALGVGGLAGSLFMMAFISRTGVKPLLALMTLLAAPCVWLISRADIQQSWVLPLIAGLGAGSIACCVGQSVLAVSFYPPALRTAGVGWAAALGRIGSIVGPAVGGALLSLGWNAREIVLTAVIPAAVALVLLLGMTLSDRRARGAVKESTSR